MWDITALGNPSPEPAQPRRGKTWIHNETARPERERGIRFRRRERNRKARPDSIQIPLVELGSGFPAESPPMAGTPAGVRGDWGLGTITRWCRFAQPPATSLQASGLPTCSGSPAEQPWRRADAHSGKIDTPKSGFSLAPGMIGCQNPGSDGVCAGFGSGRLCSSRSQWRGALHLLRA